LRAVRLVEEIVMQIGRKNLQKEEKVRKKMVEFEGWGME